jgi:hypothetical protein
LKVVRAHVFRGEHITAVSRLRFYGFQWIQHLIVVVLAWPQFPQLLIFSILQYGLSTGLGFGFPSEILLAPGFFLICVFARFESQCLGRLSSSIRRTGLSHCHSERVAGFGFQLAQAVANGTKPTVELKAIRLLQTRGSRIPAGRFWHGVKICLRPAHFSRTPAL